MKISVLDHGYVELIEAWGRGSARNDEPLDFEVGIIEAARQSTQGAFKGWNEDTGLLRTLFNHQANQSTPFEAAGMTIEVNAPIFIFREWHRHRTQSYNEASGRYIKLEPIHYRPNAENVLERSRKAVTTKNKQAGSVAPPPDERLVTEWLFALDEAYGAAEAFYRYGLAIGIPKELARIAMPVGHYSRMRATANLRNWLAFLTLRLDEKAQWEIREYAHAVGSLVCENFPHTWSLFNESRSQSPA